MIQLDDKLYTSTEVADILGVSLRSVYRYLEENKIDAEVKTATGRHRFSKKNILDFLYPNGSSNQTVDFSQSYTKTAETPVVKKKDSATPIKPKIVEPAPEPEVELKEDLEEEVKMDDEPAVEEEPIDWLAKFREAAQKYREEAEQSSKAQAPVEAESHKEEIGSMSDNVKAAKDSVFGEDAKFSSIAPKKVKEDVQNYYRSSLGGLKEIAQNIDRGSRNSYLDYAFTLNAGLSLFKPIKPFSILHAYVRENDLSFFEKLLGLTPSDEANAQLCLILSSNEDLYKNREEMHGLFVVEKKKLLADIQKYSDSALAAEASSILK